MFYYNSIHSINYLTFKTGFVMSCHQIKQWQTVPMLSSYNESFTSLIIFIVQMLFYDFQVFKFYKFMD